MAESRETDDIGDNACKGRSRRKILQMWEAARSAALWLRLWVYCFVALFCWKSGCLSLWGIPGENNNFLYFCRVKACSHFKRASKNATTRFRVLSYLPRKMQNALANARRSKHNAKHRKPWCEKAFRPHPHRTRTRNARKWDLLMWMGVSTLHVSNIKGFAKKSFWDQLFTK